MTDQRRADLAKIHIAAKQLGMDPADKDPKSTYRTMLWTLGRVRSSAELDHAGRARVLDHLKGRGFKARMPRKPTPAGDKEALLGKIRALLGERPEAYADGMARHMFTVERITWCTPEQLRKIVAALNYDKRRHA